MVSCCAQCKLIPIYLLKCIELTFLFAKIIMGCLGATIGALIFTVTEAAILALTVIGTPLAQFKYDGSEDSNLCYTQWGLKEDCKNTGYTARGIQAFGCKQRQKYMLASICGTLGSVLLVGLTLLCCVFLIVQCCKPTVFAFILCAGATATLFLSWSAVARIYHAEMCTDCTLCFLQGSFKSMNLKFGSGFYMFVAASCLQALNTVYFLFMSCCL